jgi:hypothetical protein
MGDKHKALTYFEQSLPILESLNDKSGVMTTLTNIAASYKALGESRKASDLSKRAKKLGKELHDEAKKIKRARKDKIKGR